MSTTRLEDFVTKKSIRAESIPGYEEMEVLGVSNKLGITVTDHKKSKDLAKYLLIEEGDFAYNPYRINVGSIGLTPAGKKGLVSPAYVVFTTTDKLIPELLLDFLKSQEGLRQIGKYARGTVRKALRFEDLAQIELPVPPMDKQIEILSKRKSIEIEADSVKSELTHQKNLLKKLRQQILQEAIEGKLTADWRAQNPDVEPASELFKRIAAEKAQLVKDKKIKAQKPLPPITDEEKLFELPQGWEWCRLASVAYGFQYGTSSKSFKTGEVPVLRMGNIQAGEINFTDLVYSSDQGEIEKYLLVDGDLLFNRTNSRELVGKTAIYRGGQVAIYAGYLVRFHMAGSIAPDFANMVMNSRLHSEWCDEVKADALGQSNINATKLSSFRFPLPSIDEQKAIVEKAKKLLALCDQLETQITQNQAHAEQLMQAVLKEAFSQNKAETQKISTVVPFKPKGSDYYKRTLLAAEIVYQLHNEPTLGHLKLQKLIYLCQKSENMQLPVNFLQQAAGPYDPQMARSLDKQLYDKGWFQYQGDGVPKYKPLQKAGEHKLDFQKYFAATQAGIQTIIDLFRKAKSDQMEIVATLYACWEKIIESKEPFSNELLIQTFYAWSEEKSKFPEERLTKAVAWMQEKNIVPDTNRKRN